VEISCAAVLCSRFSCLFGVSIVHRPKPVRCVREEKNRGYKVNQLIENQKQVPRNQSSSAIFGAIGDSGEAERSFRREADRHSEDDPEHHRSVATLAPRLCKKCSAPATETCPERSGGRTGASAVTGAGKGAAALVPTTFNVPGEKQISYVRILEQQIGLLESHLRSLAPRVQVRCK
jgi:hypothetical protein